MFTIFLYTENMYPCCLLLGCSEEKGAGYSANSLSGATLMFTIFLYTENMYPCCLLLGCSEEKGENQSRENRPNTA